MARKIGGNCCGSAGLLGRLRRGDEGFTLVEILIVVIILGILAAIVLPQFSNASQLARENTLRDELRYLRTQITVYAAQHRDVSPGYPASSPSGTPTQDNFLAQMENYTDDSGNTSTSFSDTFQFGPYLSKMPYNPENTNSLIVVVPNGQPLPPPDNTTGFIYQPQSQIIEANLTGIDTNGNSFINY
jgi:general secretion pathway protein G